MISGLHTYMYSHTCTYPCEPVHTHTHTHTSTTQDCQARSPRPHRRSSTCHPLCAPALLPTCLPFPPGSLGRPHLSPPGLEQSIAGGTSRIEASLVTLAPDQTCSGDHTPSSDACHPNILLHSLPVFVPTILGGRTSLHETGTQLKLKGGAGPSSTGSP